MNITQWFCLLMLAFTLVMDIVFMKGGLSSESEEVKKWELRWTWLPLGLGIILGHWCFPGHVVNGDLKVVLPSLLMAFTGDILYHHFDHEAIRPWWRYPGLWALAGIPIGLFFWGQPL